MMETRKFDGKMFQAFSWHGTKALAEARAAEYRRKGFLVRVVPTHQRNKYGRAGYGYRLWTRRA